MIKILTKIFCAGALVVSLPAHSTIINFDFTGRLVVADMTGSIIGPAYTPIAASLSYDTVSGIGGSALSITMNDFYLGSPATFHDITMQHRAGTEFIDGTVLFDWNSQINQEIQIEWNATGLFNAINYGLQAGDVLSGTDLYHDSNGNGVQDPGEYIMDIFSATPYSDSLQIDPANRQGAAPMAATGNSAGVVSGDFIGVKAYFDIGSGNSMHVTSVSAVPVPAALWLFGSGLISLAAFARRKASA